MHDSGEKKRQNNTSHSTVSKIMILEINSIENLTKDNASYILWCFIFVSTQSYWFIVSFSWEICEYLWPVTYMSIYAYIVKANIMSWRALWKWYRYSLFTGKQFILKAVKLADVEKTNYPIFLNLNDISPGSSHPSIQRGARSLTGDLPTTAPSPLTFEFWKLFPTLLYCLWLYWQWSVKYQLNTLQL